MGQVTYTFTGANGTVDSSLWTDTNSQGLWTIASNAGKTTVAATQEMKYTGFAPPAPNYSVSLNLSVAGSGAQYLVIWARMTGADGTKTGYKSLWDFGGSAAYLYQTTNNTDITTICSGVSFSNAVNNPVGILVSATTIALIQNGSVLSGGSGTDSAVSAVGTGGIGLYNPNNDMRFTNFQQTWGGGLLLQGIG